MVQQEKSPPVRQRKRIWEIEDSFKCPLIGTCLGRVELRRLSRERVFEIEPGLDDYQLHSRFIRISAQENMQSRALHKYLEKKYRQRTKKYLQVATDREIRSLWEEDLSEGRVDSAWWAILTHPLVSEELVNQLYGQLHMLGHEYTNGYHKERVRRGNLRNKVAMLEEILGSERQYHRQEQRRLKEEMEVLRKEVVKHRILAVENRALLDEKAELGDRIQELTAARELAGERQRIAELQQDNNGLRGRCDEQTDELESVRRQLEQVKQQVVAMEEDQARMARQRTDQMREIASLENMLLQRLSEEDPCAVCADHNTVQCPGLSLCGKTVLYVGGLHKMVPHYRQLVEHLGGRFMHHDGGKEASRNLLPKMLVTADAVFCPIDCVSHDACKQVKKMCKRYRKPFVLMRSSGLSSLAKGLNQIVQ